MKIRILEKDRNLLRLEVEGEGHTLCSILQTEILEEDGVEIAGYDKHHPLEERSILYVRTTGKASPEDVLRKAADKAFQMAVDFQSVFEKEMAAAAQEPR